MTSNIKSFVGFLSRLVSTGLLLSYLVGFIAWNYFLSQYSFFEYNLLQTRYISAGLLFLLPTGLFFLALFVVESLVISYCKLQKTKLYKVIRNVVGAIIFILFLIMFLVIFGEIPPYLGGAKPFVTAIMTTPEQIEYLKNFNIKVPKNSSVETMPLCNIYQNNDYVIVGVVEKTTDHITLRVLVIKQALILGFNQRTRYEEGEKEICNYFKDWTYKTKIIESNIQNPSG